MNALQEARRIRSLVVAGSVFGLTIAIALGIGAGSRSPGWSSAVFALMFAAPFVVALFATRFTRVTHQRAGWAVAAVLSGLIGVALATSIGIFYLALAAGFALAAIASWRIPRHSQTGPGAT